jgi:hypothetical protein
MGGRREGVPRRSDDAPRATEKTPPTANGDVAWATSRVNASIAASLIDIAETFHAIRAGADKQAGLD